MDSFQPLTFKEKKNSTARNCQCDYIKLKYSAQQRCLLTEPTECAQIFSKYTLGTGLVSKVCNGF